jgi:PAS domain S-box-containing protein
MELVFGEGREPIEKVAARAARVLGPDAIVWEGDASTFAFTYVNAAAERVLGYPARAWTGGATFWADSVVHGEDRDEAIAYCALATASCSDHRFEYRARTAEGRVIWLRDYVQVILGSRRVPERLRGVMIDVTAERNLGGGGPSTPQQCPARSELLTRA